MKTKKWGAMILAVSMLVPMCACKKDPTDETEETSPTSSTSRVMTASTTETSESTVDTTPATKATTSYELEDESEDPIIIYGYDRELKKLLDAYVSELNYEFIYVEPDEYYKKLNEALQGDEKVPDMFMMDASHLQEWSYSDKTLSMDQLGIQRNELSDQFAYTYEAACDADHAVKALSYELSPSVIFYNRALAAQTLETGDPATVAGAMADWDAILDYAREVNVNSEGVIKLLADRKQIHDIFWAGHSAEWIKDGKVVTGSDLDQYILLQEALFVESLTGEKEVGSKEWRNDILQEKTIMFFGSLQTAADVIGFVPGHEEKDEPETTSSDSQTAGTETTGETTVEEPEETGWAIIPAPAATYDGGSWLMVASSSDKRATAALILRALTMEQTVMTDMAVNGKFVNSISIMKSCADDPNFISDFLGGQNPYAILVPEALKIRIPNDPQTEKYADKEIDSLIKAYLDGEIKTPDELKEQFVVGMEELMGLT
ncbi:MAG: extracellular solute-binding protein [Clostridiales bacterium]|nr:extracellular solute-binding protein [Clostridiales bacterium]